MALVAAACGDSGSGATTTTVATNCDEVAEALVEVVDDAFGQIDTLQATGTDAAAINARLDEFKEEVAQLRAQSRALECKVEDVDSYFCGNVGRIQPQGEIATGMLADTIQDIC